MIFGRVAAFCDSCAYGLNNTATPPPDTIIRAIFQVVKGAQSPIYSTAPLLFSTIVAVVEVDGASQTLVIVAFREFQESEAHGDRFRANP